MLASCMLLTTLILAAICLIFGVLQISSDEIKTETTGIIFTFFGFIFLFSAIGLYKRNKNAHRTIRTAYAVFTLYGAAYLVIISPSEQVLWITVMCAVCLLLSFTGYVTDYHPLF